MKTTKKYEYTIVDSADALEQCIKRTRKAQEEGLDAAIADG